MYPGIGGSWDDHLITLQSDEYDQVILEEEGVRRMVRLGTSPFVNAVFDSLPNWHRVVLSDLPHIGISSLMKRTRIGTGSMGYVYFELGGNVRVQHRHKGFRILIPLSSFMKEVIKHLYHEPRPQILFCVPEDFPPGFPAFKTAWESAIQQRLAPTTA